MLLHPVSLPARSFRALFVALLVSLVAFALAPAANAVPVSLKALSLTSMCRPTPTTASLRVSNSNATDVAYQLTKYGANVSYTGTVPANGQVLVTVPWVSASDTWQLSHVLGSGVTLDATKAIGNNSPCGNPNLCDTISSNLELPAGDTTISCDTTIPKGVTLSVPASAKLHFANNATLTVVGSLEVNGAPVDNLSGSAGKFVFDSGTGYFNASSLTAVPFEGTSNGLTIVNSTLSASPVNVVGPLKAESDSFKDSPLTSSASNPVLGGNTFDGSASAPLNITGASSLSGLGSNTVQANGSDVSTVISDSVAGNWVATPGSYLLSNVSVDAKSVLTINPGVHLILATSLQDSGVIQTSRSEKDPAVSFEALKGDQGINVASSGVLFANGVSFTHTPITAKGATVLLFNSSFVSSPVVNAASPFGPVVEGNSFDAGSRVTLSGGTPVVGGDTFASEVASPLSISGATDVSLLGQNHFNMPSGLSQVSVTNSHVTGTWNIDSAVWSLDGVTVDGGGVATTLPGAVINVGKNGVAVSGTLQVARSVKDAAVSWSGPIAVNNAGVAFLYQVDVSSSSITATSPKALLQFINNKADGVTISVAGAANGPFVEGNAFSNSSVKITTSPNAVVAGNTGL